MKHVPSQRVLEKELFIERGSKMPDRYQQLVGVHAAAADGPVRLQHRLHHHGLHQLQVRTSPI
jgi:hypothetical protein